MADDERETDPTGAGTSGVPAPGAGAPDTDVPGIDTSREEGRLAESQRAIDEAKAVAADLALTTPDPPPDAEPPTGPTPASRPRPGRRHEGPQWTHPNGGCRSEHGCG